MSAFRYRRGTEDLLFERDVNTCHKMVRTWWTRWVIGPHLPRVQTTVELFAACKRAITGHDPVEDSVALARMLIADPNLGGRASDLEVLDRSFRRLLTKRPV